MNLTNNQYIKYLSELLSASLPYKFRVGAKMGSFFQIMSYIDARDAMDRLDEVCIFGWEREDSPIVTSKGVIWTCKVGIVMPDGTRLYRSDIGTESNTEAEKGAASDSFKRACVNWGIGRFLYDLPKIKCPYKDSGKKDKYDKPILIPIAEKALGNIKAGDNLSYNLNEYYQIVIPQSKAKTNLLTLSKYETLIKDIDQNPEKKEKLITALKEKHYIIPSVFTF